jgi:hypothetical protein
MRPTHLKRMRWLRDLRRGGLTGKSFDTMAIDIFTVRNGKLATAYHVENWAGALQQIAG